MAYRLRSTAPYARPPPAETEHSREGEDEDLRRLSRPRADAAIVRLLVHVPFWREPAQP